MATDTKKNTAMTTREVAEAVGTDPRTLRKFLRSRDMGVGAGSRYEFKADDLPELKKAFTAWAKSKGDAPAPAPEAAAADEVAEGITADEVRAALNEHSVKELQDTAKERGITGYSSMKKADLIDAIITAHSA
jgi:hypothetical protein